MNIQRILAVVDGRRVEVLDVENGMALVRPTRFDPYKDPAVYYHIGWTTPVSNIHSVTVVYDNGETEFMGEPPVNQAAADAPAQTTISGGDVLEVQPYRAANTKYDETIPF